MYGHYLTQKVQARRNGETIEKLVLDEFSYRSLREDRYVRDSLDETDPVRFGLSGDFDVVQGAENKLVTDAGDRVIN